MEANGTRAGPVISRGGSGLPSRMVFHGVPGVGKTTFGALSVKPIFSMTRGETGLLTLIDNDLIGETDHFDECRTWFELLGNVAHLIRNETNNRTFVLDTLNGAERLCFEAVCQERYKNDWDSFMSYGRGPDVAQQEWLKLIALLDELRAARRMAIMCLCHTKVKTYKNPEGDDYDRYTPDLHEKTWNLTHKWADVIVFGNFETFAKKDKSALRAKGQGGENRILYTSQTAAWDAKNRHRLPREIPMGCSPEEGWTNFYESMRKARQDNRVSEPAPITSATETES